MCYNFFVKKSSKKRKEMRFALEYFIKSLITCTIIFLKLYSDISLTYQERPVQSIQNISRVAASRTQRTLPTR